MCRRAIAARKIEKFDASLFTEPTYRFPQIGRRDKRPIIVGFGPAGMFAALSLARAGMCPLVLERGCAVEQRQRDVDEFFGGGKLKDNSNIQFGEGGAGTFSDGKLNTGIKDGRIRTVLHTFAEHGAGERILYDAKPHIGTDVLVNVVRSIREEIKNSAARCFLSIGSPTLRYITVPFAAWSSVRLTVSIVSTVNG